MSASTRRPPSNSLDAQIKSFADTKRRIEWPTVEVTRLPRPEDDEKAQAIFDRIITSRAPDDWRQHDPVFAAQLANVTVELDKLMALVAKTGWVTQAGKHGTQFARTPLLDPIQHLTTRQLSLARALGLSGEPTDARTVDKNARASAAAARAAGAAGDDDAYSLLAR
jgi:hypothetical protein